MPDKTIHLARKQLGFLDRDLAGQLGGTEGCLRSWYRKGAPRYTKLALMAGLVLETDDSPPVHAFGPPPTPIAAE